MPRLRTSDCDHHGNYMCCVHLDRYQCTCIAVFLDTNWLGVEILAFVEEIPHNLLPSSAVEQP